LFIVDKSVKEIIYEFDKILGQRLKKSFAKSDGTTLDQHINDLAASLQQFLRFFPEELTDCQKNILKLAIYFHDLGKLNILFQKKLQNKTNDIVPHNILSGIFSSLLNGVLSYEGKILIFHAVINHHNRGLEFVMNEYLGTKILKQKISDNIDNFALPQWITIKEISDFYDLLNDISKIYALIHNSSKTSINNINTTDLLIVSGFLIRLDHAASAGLDVEDEPITEERERILNSFLRGKSFRPFQLAYGQNKKGQNLCLVADTGMGKTGLSVLWSQRKKFYVLPNRASVNAMYNTLSNVYGDDKVGLLHSTALFNLLSSKTDDDDGLDTLKEYEQTRLLAKPVTVCTADQLFTSAFHYPGYEKIYATLAYSDIVIDEIQGFSPQQIIPILKQIEETVKIGAKYLVITATLPTIVAQRFKDIGIEVVSDAQDTKDQTIRHHVKYEDCEITKLIEPIVDKFRCGKKVLIVANTVGRAQELYNLFQSHLDEQEMKKVKILHSRFIWMKRQKLEQSIISDCAQDENDNYVHLGQCIWITTQLVEASLDIDYEYLFTELSTADSLIQRMGRIWRHRHYNYQGEPNIIIAGKVKENVNWVYEKPLRDKTKELLMAVIRKNDGYMLSCDKRWIVSELYSTENLTSTKYIEKWKQVEAEINSGWNIILDQLQKSSFRDVMTVDLIPAIFKTKILTEYKKLNNLPKSLSREQKRLARAKILMEIQKYKVPIPLYCVNTSYAFKKIGIAQPVTILDHRYNIAFLDKRYEYSETLGFTGKAIEIEEMPNII